MSTPIHSQHNTNSLMLAAENASIALVKLLLEYSADTNITTSGVAEAWGNIAKTPAIFDVIMAAREAAAPTKRMKRL